MSAPMRSAKALERTKMNDLGEDVRSPVPARVVFHSKLKNRHQMTAGAIFER